MFEPSEAGCVWEPDVAAPHAGAGSKDSSLRAVAQRLPEEAAWWRSGPKRCREWGITSTASITCFFFFLLWHTRCSVKTDQLWVEEKSSIYSFLASRQPVLSRPHLRRICHLKVSPEIVLINELLVICNVYHGNMGVFVCQNQLGWLIDVSVYVKRSRIGNAEMTVPSLR